MQPQKILDQISHLRAQHIMHLKKAEEHTNAANECIGAIKAYETVLNELGEQEKQAAEQAKAARAAKGKEKDNKAA